MGARLVEEGVWCDCKGRKIFVVIERLCIVIEVVFTQIYTHDEMTEIYTVYQCQFPGFDIVL